MNGIQKETIELPNGFSFEMIEVKGGVIKTYLQSNLRVGDYWLGKFQVTQYFWEVVMGASTNPSHFKGPRRPVDSVNWFQALAFCNRLNLMLNLPNCYFTDDSYSTPVAMTSDLNDSSNIYSKVIDFSFRLPNEAEWELASTTNQISKEHDFSGSDRLNDVSWNFDNSNKETQEVGLLFPNNLGIYDLSGNVEEWCFEKLGTSFRNNQMDLPRNGYVVLKGGSWKGYDGNSSVTGCLGYPPTRVQNTIGFRLARSKSTN
jgi:formylglycine-generating enzyme required for sulfatase activity